MRIRQRSLRRGRNGAVLAESAASLCLILPILFIALFCAIEASIAFTIAGAMNQSSYWAARRVAINYAIVKDHALTDASYTQNGVDYGYNAAFMNQTTMVKDPSQFSMTYNTASVPPTVTVTCQYLGESVGLPPFPNPDPLHLASGPNPVWSGLVISGTSTVRLQ